jgi:putative hydrolase of the HAD superfamily
MIKAVTFDFWNTLFTAPREVFDLYHLRRVEILCAALGADHDRERLSSLLHDDLEVFAQIWREEHRTPTARERLEYVLAQLDAPLAEVECARLAELFEEGLLERPPEPVPGAREVVERLGARYPLAIISDTGFSPGRVLRKVIESAEILSHFRAFAFSNELGRSKPHGEVFLQTARALGAEPEHIVHIGDLEPTDIVGAKAVGMYAIRFVGCTPLGANEVSAADAIVGNLLDVPRVIDRLSNAARGG